LLIKTAVTVKDAEPSEVSVIDVAEDVKRT
jgi:hypothetical protein